MTQPQLARTRLDNSCVSGAGFFGESMGDSGQTGVVIKKGVQVMARVDYGKCSV